MRYLNQITWEITPNSLPTITKSCPKCGNHTDYINTEKFRVNANKKSLDIWLIYQCYKCKSTFNLTIFERIHPKKLDRNIHDRFLKNDPLLAREYGFNRDIHSKNKVLINVESVEYQIDGPAISLDTTDNMTINIKCHHNLNLRIDAVLSQKLQCSRSQIKKLFDGGRIQILEGTHASKILQERIITISGESC